MYFITDSVYLIELQFSDIIKNPVPFKDSTDGATNKEVTSELTKAVNGLGFIGQGAYLNKGKDLHFFKPFQ